jgi:hypothetical protein
MDKMNFTQGEREFIIADIKHKEAELLRLQYVSYSYLYPIGELR